ncbi:bifunctional epoxide hydrolase 2 [Gadus morhua]|uniref:bifunctional epoxide hydrolase 2 n=1 Tax=Gadus morhua TaxID=8049 RepID=UPI0011B42791|nr:bifunctional epoxide hydrolase 2 [Gadus morhua]
MEPKKAVLMDLWGVVVRPGLRAMFQQFEELHRLPGGFVWNAARKTDGVLKRAERGEISLSQMIVELDSELVTDAETQGVTLPCDGSVRELLIGLGEVEADQTVLQTVLSLHRHGIRTAVLANHWVDDSASGPGWARLLSVLHAHFDRVLLSCRESCRVPEPALFTAALKGLGVTPQQTLYLCEEGESVVSAEAEGLTVVRVDQLTAALNKLASLTSLPASTGDDPPMSCRPDTVSHGYVSIKPGVRTHYVTMGNGPPVLLCHGFPESWYSWRYQIPALAAAGFSVFALDMKGYGESTAPEDIEEYSQEQLCKDLISFMDILAIPQVTLIGHDWGGALVWSMAKYFPERVRAVASLNTPLFPVDPTSDPLMKVKAIPIFDYQIYFQEPGVAEAELETDLERTFNIFFLDSRPDIPQISTAGVCARGGLFVGLPEEIPRSNLVTESDLQFYVEQFKDSGFRRPLNWYRNIERNWRWMCSRPRGKLMMPALMVTAGKDFVLLPILTKGMEEQIPNLTRNHIEDCGHWTQMEKPAEVNRILITWLQETHRKLPVTMAPKL